MFIFFKKHILQEQLKVLIGNSSLFKINRIKCNIITSIKQEKTMLLLCLLKLFFCSDDISLRKCIRLK